MTEHLINNLPVKSLLLPYFLEACLTLQVIWIFCVSWEKYLSSIAWSHGSCYFCPLDILLLYMHTCSSPTPCTCLYPFDMQMHIYVISVFDPVRTTDKIRNGFYEFISQYICVIIYQSNIWEISLCSRSTLGFY